MPTFALLQLRKKMRCRAEPMRFGSLFYYGVSIPCLMTFPEFVEEIHHRIGADSVNDHRHQDDDAGGSPEAIRILHMTLVDRIDRVVERPKPSDAEEARRKPDRHWPSRPDETEKHRER